jgi:hypothetical protein
VAHGGLKRGETRDYARLCSKVSEYGPRVKVQECREIDDLLEEAVS